jgi:hypothetical protein
LVNLTLENAPITPGRRNRTVCLELPVAGESYAETFHGLFPRFLLASSAIAVGGFLVQVFEAGVFRYLVAGVSFSSPSYSYYQGLIGLLGDVYVPFVAFGLFYLTSRVRIVLDRDYIGVASSILLGCFVVELVLNFTVFYGQEYNLLGNLVQEVGYSLAYSSLYTFIGFSAVLLSYLRRM